MSVVYRLSIRFHAPTIIEVGGHLDLPLTVRPSVRPKILYFVIKVEKVGASVSYA